MASSVSLGGLISTILFAVVGIVLTVTIAVPIISDFAIDETMANASAMNTMIGVIPVFIVMMILIAVCYQIIRYTNGKE